MGPAQPLRLLTPGVNTVFVGFGPWSGGGLASVGVGFAHFVLAGAGGLCRAAVVEVGLAPRSTRFVLAVAAEGWVVRLVFDSSSDLTWDVLDDVTDLSLLDIKVLTKNCWLFFFSQKNYAASQIFNRFFLSLFNVTPFKNVSGCAWPDHRCRRLCRRRWPLDRRMVTTEGVSVEGIHTGLFISEQEHD